MSYGSYCFSAYPESRPPWSVGSRMWLYYIKEMQRLAAELIAGEWA